MRKTYEVRGMMEWHPMFKAGRTRIRVSFQGGHMCAGGATAATYATSDPVVQAVIERSEAFRKGKIRLAASRPERVEATAACRPKKEPEAGKPKEAHAAGMPEKNTVVEPGNTAEATEDTAGLFRYEYSDINDLTEMLHYGKGVPLERLLSEDECRREAEKLGIEIVRKE